MKKHNLKNKKMKKRNLKNKKNMLIIILIIIAIVSICLIIGISLMKNIGTSKKKLENNLKDIGMDFYENYYYDANKEQIQNISESGLSIDINNLSLVIPIDQKINDKLVAYECDLDESKILIYPNDPFGKKDYTVEVNLSCK